MRVDAVPVSVSINGIDNVGKTTQIAWLHRGFPGAHMAGTVDAWEPRWKQVAAGDFAHWWFVGSTTSEHVELMMRSHVARRAASGPLALEDRGLPMLRAACAATAVLKDGLGHLEALQKVEALTARQPAADIRRELHILLRRFSDPVQEAAEAMRREPSPPDERYAAYQRVLAAVLALQIDRGEYDVVLDLGDLPILDVQRQVRACLIGAGLAVQPLPEGGPERVWVLGGLSESGKSTVGELLRDEYGVARLKIGYLLEVAALRAGIEDPYVQWSEREQAERLSEELLRYADANKARTVSLESAHRFESTAHLKRIWGHRCQVIFVDANSAIRASRAAETEEELRSRDTIKRDRGAHCIAGIADTVIDNSGPRSALTLAVARTVFAADVPGTADLGVTSAATHEWVRLATDHILDEHVALVLATGSTATPTWRPGWSDLDLLVVRDSAPAAWLADVIGGLPQPSGVKTGISVFTTADISALRVPPRVVQSLRRAAQGMGVIYHRPGYQMPVPTAAYGDRTSRGELGLVVMTTRRLLAQREVDIRAVHKHLVLLAKILLRADGLDIHDAEQVLATFCDRHPETQCNPPDLSVLIEHPDDPDLRRQLVEATDALLTYLDHLDRTGRP